MIRRKKTQVNLNKYYTTQYFKALNTGILWGVMFFFVRKSYNPDVKNVLTTSDDAITGGMAAYTLKLFSLTVNKLIDYNMGN